MTKYTITEVGSLEEWANLQGVAPGKEFVDEQLSSEFVGLSVNSTPPGGESPFWHTHTQVEEIYVFLTGQGEMALDEEVIPVRAGTIVRVPTGVWRALRCLPTSEQDMQWLCLRGGGESLATIGQDGELDSERPFPWS